MKQNITKIKARELYLSGKNTREVAEELEIGNATVYRWLKDIMRPKGTTYKGKNHFAWKGGSQNKQGYICIWRNGKLTKEHIILMEEKIGKKLTKDEVVHHINEIKNDNRIENLMLLTRSQHIILHRKNKPSQLRGRKLGKYSDTRRKAIGDGIRRYHASAY